MKIFKKIMGVMLAMTIIGSLANTFANPLPLSPGVKTIKNFLQTALTPVGSTMYIWGGGWDETEDNPGDSSVNIGLLSDWKEFSEKQTSNYNFKDYCLPIAEDGRLLPKPETIGYGLDCSGLIGWAVYNVMNTESGGQSFVCKARTMAKTFAEKYKFGEYKDFGLITDIAPGDIISICNEKRKSHVYIALGQCKDGSILIIESAPPGVQIRGTQNHEGNLQSQAVALAEVYMSKYYPEWYKKFPNCVCFPDDYRNDSLMHWEISETSIIQDPDGYIKKSPEEILKDLYREN
ncbi:hypothetical protein FACS189465_3240 [Clostridia bacterium]|nr:hypothetical protein FACS189465_3240 [Clostridia bacterium]